MDENPHNRLLRVDRIFLVNESGERFLLPFKSVVGAKAMANHVGRGGNPYDTTGKLIGNAVNEMTNLRRFASATRRKTFESDDAHQVIEAARSIKESIQRSLFRLANNSRFDENIEDLNKLLAEQDDVEDIKPYFMQNTYNENLDNWLGSAAKAFKQYKGNIMENLRESAGTVAQKLSNPQWKLILKDEPAEDRIIASSKYADGRALLRRILGTIADRASMDDSDIANWASQIGQDMEMGGASQEDMQIALHLAKRYQNDLAMIAKSPEYGKEVRVPAFGQKKDLYGKVKGEEEEFESYVHGIGEAGNEEMEEADDEQHGLPPMSAGERIQQKLGTGAFAPQKAGPVNKEPLPGSPGPDQADKDALTRMIDNESAEGSETAMDRVSARVAGRTTNEALDTMMWLAGVKKKSDVSEADFTPGFQGKYNPLDDIRDTFKSGNPASTAPKVKVAPTPGQGFTTGGTSGTGTAVEPRAPNVTLDPDERMPTTPGDDFRDLKSVTKLASKGAAAGIIGGGLLDPHDPFMTAIGLGQKSPSAADDEMSPEKANSMRLKSPEVKSTMFNPEPVAQQPANMQSIPNTIQQQVNPNLYYDTNPIAKQKQESAELNQMMRLAGLGNK